MTTLSYRLAVFRFYPPRRHNQIHCLGASRLRSRKTTRNFALTTCLLKTHTSALVTTAPLALDTALLGSLPHAVHGMNELCHLARSVRLRDHFIPTAICRQLDLPHVWRPVDQQIKTITASGRLNTFLMTAPGNPIAYALSDPATSSTHDSNTLPGPRRTFLDSFVGASPN